MGIPIEDPEKIPAPGGCGRCFPSGETPRYIFCAVSGVSKGPFWQSPSGPVPNGLFIIEYQSGCLWSGSFGLWDISYTAMFTGAEFRLFHVLHGNSLFGKSSEECGGNFALVAQPNLAPFFEGGFALCGIQDDCPLLSLNQLGADFGLGPNNETFAEMFPIDEDFSVIRYAFKQDKTNIKILIDCS